MTLACIPRLSPRLFDPRSAGRWLVALAVGWLTAALPLPAAIYRVGPGAGCTHADLASAVVAAASNPGPDEILLLANSVHQGPFVIFTDGLTLTGGYADCTASVPTGTSTLLGDNASRGLFFALTGSSTLRRLQVSGGTVSGNGGGLWVQGNAQLILDQVSVFGNSATGRGGNVYVNAFSGLQVIVSGASLISAGNAQDGGGLACTGEGTVQLGAAVLVANNEVTGNGGGVFLTSGCYLLSQAGGGAAGGILGNTAGGNGGGAYVEAGADLGTTWAVDGLSRIEGNSADGVGGGVFVTGTGSTYIGLFTRISGNHADAAGGGIGADFSAVVQFVRTADPNPCDAVRCARIDNNSAGEGGALSADGFANVLIDGTYIETSSSTVAHPVAYVAGGADVELRSSVLAGNSGLRPFYVEGAGSNLVLGNVTVVDNSGIGGGLFEIGPGNVTGARIYSSVFAQAGVLFAPGYPAGAVPTVDCVISSLGGLLAGLPAQTVLRLVQVTDPQLAAPAAGDYRLRHTSPAIDFCDTSQWLSGVFDVEGGARDLDDPGHPNPMLGGVRDAGADEFDTLFGDGFESGDLAAWSAASP